MPVVAALGVIYLWRVGWPSFDSVGEWLSIRFFALAMTAIVLLLSLQIAGVGRAPRGLFGWPLIVVALITTALAGWITTSWLIDRAIDNGLTTALAATARVDAVKTGLAAAAGIGAVAIFLLSVRRQWHQERVAVIAEHDATERRITELSTKAIEQLGHVSAAVRLGGLYALERLAQGTPTQRDAIVDVLCSYLRMPIPTIPPLPPHSTVTAALGDRESTEQRDHIERLRYERDQEGQVRLTAQRILVRHRRRAQPTLFWDTTEIDLTGAQLRSADFSHTDLTGAQFGSADLTLATFRGANLTNADLRKANLHHANLLEVTDIGANFDQANRKDTLVSFTPPADSSLGDDQ